MRLTLTSHWICCLALSFKSSLYHSWRLLHISVYFSNCCDKTKTKLIKCLFHGFDILFVVTMHYSDKCFNIDPTNVPGTRTTLYAKRGKKPAGKDKAICIWMRVERKPTASRSIRVNGTILQERGSLWLSDNWDNTPLGTGISYEPCAGEGEGWSPDAPKRGSLSPGKISHNLLHHLARQESRQS